MKNLLCTFLISLLITVTSPAQNPGLDWVRSGGSQSTETGEAIAIDPAGNVVIAGNFTNTVDFDPGAGTTSLTSFGEDDIFILKLDPAGNFIWVKQLGSPDNDLLNSMTLDALGNILLAGYFKDSCEMDPGAGSIIKYTGGGPGDQDIFIVKLDPAGNHLWSHAIGGTEQDQGISITTDANNNVYTAGHFRLTVDFDPGTVTNNLTSAGNVDVFILKLDAGGNYIWSGSFGGMQNDYIRTISVDNLNNMYIGGHFEGTSDFDPGAGITTLNAPVSFDAYLLKLNPAGIFNWVKKLSSSSTATDLIETIKCDNAGMLYITGIYRNTIDLDPGSGVTSVTSQGLTDFFVSKFDTSGNFIRGFSFGELLTDIAFDIHLHNNNTEMLLTGRFGNSVDFDIGTGTALLTSEGSDDIFIVNLDTAGNHLWSKHFGGNFSEMGQAITTDAAGKVYATGFFTGQCDFDPNSGTFNVNTMGGSDYFVLKLGPVVSGLDNERSTNPSIYPSPFTESFTIQLAQFSTSTMVEITDVSGRLVHHETFTNSDKLKITTSIPKGLYIVNITTDNKKSVHPIIRE